MTEDEILYAITALALVSGFWSVDRLIDWREKRKAQRSARASDERKDSRARAEKDASGKKSGTSETEAAGKRERQWFEVLNVDPKSSIDQIRAAYRLAIASYHPDKVVALAPEFRLLAESRSKEINAAYEVARKIRKFR